MAPATVTRIVERVGKKAGLVDVLGRHVAHAHGLRHSAGSIALAEGVVLMDVSLQLRHSRADFTARVYAHHLGDGGLDRFAAAHSTRSDAAQAAPIPTLTGDEAGDTTSAPVPDEVETR